MMREPLLLTYEHAIRNRTAFRFLADPTTRDFVEMYAGNFQALLSRSERFGRSRRHRFVNVEQSRSPSNGRFVVLCAFADERPVGVTIFSVVCNPQLSLMRAQYTAVRPSSRRQGLGRALGEARDTIAHALSAKLWARPLNLSCVASVDPAKLSRGVAARQAPSASEVEKLWRGLGTEKRSSSSFRCPLTTKKQPSDTCRSW